MSQHLAQVREHFGLLHPQEVAMLQAFAKALPEDSVVVNIGAGRGTSALAFIEANSDILLYTVDIQDALAVDGSLESERITLGNAGYGHLLNFSWYQIEGDSKQVAKIWRQQGYPWIDLLFIDGDHSYEGAAGDIEGWLPHVVNDGFVAVHDYKKAEHDPTEYGRTHPLPGVDRAVDELLLPVYPLVGQVETLVVFRKEFV